MNLAQAKTTRDIFNTGYPYRRIFRFQTGKTHKIIQIDALRRSMRNTQKKRDILTEKRESWMALEKRDLPPENSFVDTL